MVSLHRCRSMLRRASRRLTAVTSCDTVGATTRPSNSELADFLGGLAQAAKKNGTTRFQQVADGVDSPSYLHTGAVRIVADGWPEFMTPVDLRSMSIKYDADNPERYAAARRYADAIRLEPSNVQHYRSLQEHLGTCSRRTIDWPDGRRLTWLQVFVEAVPHTSGSTRAELCTDVARQLKSSEVVTLCDGRVAGRKDLFALAVEASGDEGHPYAFVSVAEAMGPRETVQLFGTTMDRVGVLVAGLEAHATHPERAQLYTCLARCLGREATVTLADGRVMSAIEAAVEVVSLQPTTPWGYEPLARLVEEEAQASLNHDVKVALADGRILGARDLYLEACRAYSLQGYCYSYTIPRTIFAGLARCLKPGEKATPHGFGAGRDRRFFAERAASGSPEAEIFATLALLMQPGEIIQLPGQAPWTREELVAQAMSHGAEKATRVLGMRLP